MGCWASRQRLLPASDKPCISSKSGGSSRWIGYVERSPNLFCAEQERRLRRANLEPVEASRDSDHGDEEEGDEDDFQFAAASVTADDDDGSLIPGLPNDVAQLCLMRLPCAKYCFSYRLVSKSWKTLFSSPHFYSARRNLVTPPPSVCFVVHGNRVRVFDTSTRTWFSLPPLPHLLDDDDEQQVRVDPYDWWRIDTVAVADGNLFVIGGEESRVPSRRVHRYDFCSAAWQEMAPMFIARPDSAAVTVGSRVYVAGGTSAEVYVPAENSWTMVSGLKRAMKACVGIEHQGKILVKGENAEVTGSPVEAQVYDPGSDVWIRVIPRLKAGLTRGPAASTAFDIVVADWKDFQLKVFNPECEDWDVVGQLPAKLSRLVSHGDELYGFTGKIKVDSVNHRVISEAPTEVWKLDIGRGIRHPQLQWERIWRETKAATKVGTLTWAPCSAHCVLLQD